MTLFISMQSPWFVNAGDRSWKIRNVPVGSKLAKFVVPRNVWLITLWVGFRVITASSSSSSCRCCCSSSTSNGSLFDAMFSLALVLIMFLIDSWVIYMWDDKRIKFN